MARRRGSPAARCATACSASRSTRHRHRHDHAARGDGRGAPRRPASRRCRPASSTARSRWSPTAGRYEVTTLRADIETDGRRAKVRVRPRLAGATPSGATSPSTRSMPTADGTVIDLVGGLADLDSRTHPLHRRCRDAHPRGLSAHPALLPLLRLVRRRPAGCRRAEGLRAAQGRARPAVGRACLGGAEEAAVGARSVARAAVDAAGRRADAHPAGKREMGHRRSSIRSPRPRPISAGRPIRCSRLEAIVPPDAERMRTLAERLKLSIGGERRACKLWALRCERRADDDRIRAGPDAL